MKTFKQFILEKQEIDSKDTSLNQVSSGIKHAVSSGMIKPNSTSLEIGGGKYDKAKEHVESNVEGVKHHVTDEFNRSKEHNDAQMKSVNKNGGADYVGCHNVLNVIKEPEVRRDVIKKVASSMHPSGVGHITVYEGSKTGEGKVTSKGWQNNKKTADYHKEIEDAVGDTHTVTRKGPNFILKRKDANS